MTALHLGNARVIPTAPDKKKSLMTLSREGKTLPISAVCTRLRRSRNPGRHRWPMSQISWLLEIKSGNFELAKYMKLPTALALTTLVVGLRLLMTFKRFFLGENGSGQGVDPRPHWAVNSDKSYCSLMRAYVETSRASGNDGSGLWISADARIRLSSPAHKNLK